MPLLHQRGQAFPRTIGISSRAGFLPWLFLSNFVSALCATHDCPNFVLSFFPWGLPPSGWFHSKALHFTGVFSDVCAAYPSPRPNALPNSAPFTSLRRLRDGTAPYYDCAFTARCFFALRPVFPGRFAPGAQRVLRLNIVFSLRAAGSVSSSALLLLLSIFIRFQFRGFFALAFLLFGVYCELLTSYRPSISLVTSPTLLSLVPDFAAVSGIPYGGR